MGRRKQPRAKKRKHFFQPAPPADFSTRATGAPPVHRS
jgi:hypothetical protein